MRFYALLMAEMSPITSCVCGKYAFWLGKGRHFWGKFTVRHAFPAHTSALTQKGLGPALICSSGRPAGDQQLRLI